MSKSNFAYNVFYGILVLITFKTLQLFFAATPAHCNQKDFHKMSISVFELKPQRELAFQVFGQPSEVFMNLGDKEVDTWKYTDNYGEHECNFKFDIHGYAINGEYKLVPKKLDPEENK